MPRRAASMVVTVACAIGAGCAPAAAFAGLQGGSSRYPAWKVSSSAYPTHLPPGGRGFIEVEIYNVGAERSAAPKSDPITVTDTLPAGVVFTGAQPSILGGPSAEPWSCTGRTVVTCSNTEEIAAGGQIGVESAAKVPAAAGLIDLEVEVPEELPDALVSLPNVVTASGGGAVVAASSSNEVVLSDAPAEFGIDNFEAWATDPDGALDTQAGSHPYELTVAFDVNANHEEGATSEESTFPESSTAAGGEARGITVNLPPGVIGDAQAVPQCARRLFDAGMCPASTQVGVDTAFLGNFGHPSFAVYNLVPPSGMPAQLAVTILGINVFLDAGVRTGGDYGVTVHVEAAAQRDILANQTVIWGVPADPSHDAERCTNGFQVCDLSDAGSSETPFLTLPTSCGAPPEFTIEDDAWADPSLKSRRAFDYPSGFTGCGRLDINPSISVNPETSDSDSPTGLSVDVKVPQEGLLEKEGLVAADIQNVRVTLPEGLVVNPGRATGLSACQLDEDGVGTEAPPSCPPASKVGTVAIATPLLASKLEGNVYVLQSNPPNLRLLVAASGSGVNIKLIGNVNLDEATGRLTTTFAGAPQLPFTDFSLSLSGGGQAALVTPTRCGSYASTSDFTPWSAPFSLDAFPESSFATNDGPDGSACASPMPFSPTLTAGSTSDQAGDYTNFSLLLQRADGQQRISTLRFTTPEGLLGMIADVPLCPEPQAAEGACSTASQIGHTIVESGPGSYPLTIPEAGQPQAPIYLTDGYKGAPYGLSIAVPVIAGPFNLGTVVVRAKIEVNPITSQLTITTDPLPTILDGVPTDVRTIEAVVDRPNFMFNPSNCDPQSFSGSATSTEGTTASISSHFEIGACQTLRFKPELKVTTSGRTSKADGASLTTKIVYPKTPTAGGQESSQANLAFVKVDLPKQLPSRLSTLQKACTAAQFNANPAGCPAASVVGHATATTPVLPVPISGPAYFVSHGGEEWPSLIIVLQGYGVTVDLVGATHITRAGVTSSTFRQIPDVPVTSFELSLPEGPHSALAAYGDLCHAKLSMPAAFTAQNGLVIHETAKIRVTKCPKPKAEKRKSKPRKKATPKKA